MIDPVVLDRAVEALVFAADAPVSAGELARLFTSVSGVETATTEVEDAVARINAGYDTTGRPFRIHAWGGGFRMATEDDVAPLIRALFAREEEKRFSRPVLETLAVVAYRQPVTKPEVDFVRGVNSDYTLRTLLEKDFVTVVGRSESLGRPLLYGTTERFLDQFGLGTLDELPRPREIEELLADPAFSRERAALLSELAAAQDADSVPDSSILPEGSQDDEPAVHSEASRG